MDTSLLDLAQFAGHTPGPWHVGEVQHARFPTYQVLDKKNEYVAIVDIYARSGADKDARLIAAAPTLLAESKRLREELKYAYRCYKEQVDDKHRIATEYEAQAERHREQIAALRDALKATK